MNTAAHPLDGLYHQALGIPAQVLQEICRRFALAISPHARHALVDDRYLSDAVQDGRMVHPGRFNAPDLIPGDITVRVPQVVEVEVREGQPVKFVVRLPATPKFDIVLACIPQGRRATVKTLWLNCKSDAHKTLDESAYRKPSANLVCVKCGKTFEPSLRQAAEMSCCSKGLAHRFTLNSDL